MSSKFDHGHVDIVDVIFVVVRRAHFAELRR
jgi:hypothetical protein